jgi:hypothetical protein
MRAFEVALARDDLDGAFTHLERAHVLGQWHVGPHVLAHLGMLRIGWRRRDLREIVGQLLRIPGGAIGSAMGRVPRGNTGGARVSAFREMPIPPDLRDLLQLDQRSSAHLTDDKA